jgi:hypothetical protein
MGRGFYGSCCEARPCVSDPVRIFPFLNWVSAAVLCGEQGLVGRTGEIKRREARWRGPTEAVPGEGGGEEEVKGRRRVVMEGVGRVAWSDSNQPGRETVTVTHHLGALRNGDGGGDGLRGALACLTLCRFRDSGDRRGEQGPGGRKWARDSGQSCCTHRAPRPSNCAS